VTWARVRRLDAPIALGRRAFEPLPRHVPDEVYCQHDSGCRTQALWITAEAAKPLRCQASGLSARSRQAITPRPLPRSSQDHSHQTLFSITTHQLFPFHFERFSSLPKRPATLLGYQQAENLLTVISHVQSWMLRASSCSLSPTTLLIFCFSPALSLVVLGILVRVV